MASKNDLACVQSAKVPRFSVPNAFRIVYMDVRQDGRRLALSGYDSSNINDTFVDLFTVHPGFQGSLLKHQPHLSKGFNKIEGSTLQSVCLLDGSVFVTCCDNTIESYDTKRKRHVIQCQFTGRASCMTTTRDGRIFIGLIQSPDVIVFDQRLNQINKFKLNGLEIGDWPHDMTVSNNKLFIISTVHGHEKALMYNINGGDIEYEFKAPNKQYGLAMSITGSEENGLIYILWWGGRGKRVVVVYSLPGGHSSLPGGHSSLPGGHSSLPGGHSSLSGCHFLASFNVSDDSLRTRVNDNVNRLFVVTEETGEVHGYDTNDIINFESLLTLIELLITEDDCKKLLKYFQVPAEEAETIQENDEPSKFLLEHLAEIGKISAVDIKHLLTACNDQGISKVSEAWTNYQRYISHQKALHLKTRERQEKQLTAKPKMTEKEREELISRLKESDDERQQLTGRLETTEEEKRPLGERLKMTEEEREQLYDKLTVAEEKFTNVMQLVAGILETTEEKMRQLEQRLDATVKEKQQQLNTTLEMIEEEKKELTRKLKESDDERRQLTGRMKRIVEENQKEFEETKSNLRAAKDDLVQAQVKYATESMALQEVLQQTREALSKQAIGGASVPVRSKELSLQGKAPEIPKLDGPVDDETLMALSRELADEWKDVGRNLGFENGELSQIAMNNANNVRQAIYTMLNRWKQKNGKDATFRALGASLAKADRKDLQDNL